MRQRAAQWIQVGCQEQPHGTYSRRLRCQPHLKSTLAIAERLASQPEHLRCRCGCAIGSRSAAKSNRMARAAGAFAATADGVCRGRECGNEQRSHVISSFPARGARSACKWCTAAGRWCSDVANSSPASASPSVGSSSRCSACVPAALACSGGIRSCDRLAQSHLKSTLAIAGTYSRRATSSAVTSSAPSCTPSVEPLLCLCASRSGHRRRHELSCSSVSALVAAAFAPAAGWLSRISSPPWQ